MRNCRDRFPLSVIIPIHRSDLDITRCLLSLSNNSRLDIQIIVAANSNSETELRSINAQIPDLPYISLLNIPKAGKSNAINAALPYVEHKYVLIGDADTIFVQNGINRCMEKLYADDRLVAITGIVDPIVCNTISAVQKFEYRRIFRIFKSFWNHFQANLIISGCAGIFKVEALREVGPYDCCTLGEDFEITMRLHEYHLRNRIPYKIEYVDLVVAKTDVPRSLKALINQRGRWFAGQVDVIWKYRKILLHPLWYRKIMVPFVLMIIFEMMTTYIKWMLVGIGIWISILTDTFFLRVFLMTEISFALFEFVFNLCLGKRVKIKGVVSILWMTCLLTAIQFVLKDTNLIIAMKMRKENKWE